MRLNVKQVVILIALFQASQVAARAEEPVQADGQPCPDVAIGEVRTYACLNEALKREAGATRNGFVVPAPPRTATAEGVFSEAGTRERLGTAFGRSAAPQRPPIVPLPRALGPTR